MNSLLQELAWPSAWSEFSAYRKEKGHLNKKEQQELLDFINEERYKMIAADILCGKGLSIPVKKMVNKAGSNKKRIVYSYTEDEMMVLKLLAFLLYKYNELQPEGCYSFKLGSGAHRAIRKIVSTPDIDRMWCYKLDISNYFNSISIPILLPILKEIMSDDAILYCFFADLLTVNKAVFEDQIVEEERGVMAGTPFSPFLANIYLGELDEYFVNLKIPYARYSDDIIVFAGSEREIVDYKTIVSGFLRKYELNINLEKEYITRPGQTWEFLGIEYKDKVIDLSSITKMKMKGKIRRKAHALRRWMLKKDLPYDKAMKAMIKSFNKKFFEAGDSNDLTWSRWFFPLVNTDKGLKEIDAYLQQYIRYISSGNHGKKNYAVRYSDMKELGYRNLVNEYYKYLERCITLSKE